MNTKPSANHFSSPHDAAIDAVLDAYGRAVPMPGIESRVAARLAAAPRPSSSHGFFFASRWLLLRRISAGALATAAACGVVAVTVQRSHRIVAPQTAARALPSTGVSAAGSAHIPVRAIPQSATIDPAAPRTPPHSRAVVSPSHGRRAAGSAVPRSPYPPESQPDSEHTDDPK